MLTPDIVRLSAGLGRRSWTVESTEVALTSAMSAKRPTIDLLAWIGLDGWLYSFLARAGAVVINPTCCYVPISPAQVGNAIIHGSNEVQPAGQRMIASIQQQRAGPSIAAMMLLSDLCAFAPDTTGRAPPPRRSRW